MAETVEKGLLLLQQGRHKMAEEELRKFLTHEPNSFAAYAYLALALSGLKKTKEGLQAADKSISLAPDHAYPHFVKSTILGSNGKLKEALACIQEAIRLDPEDPDFYDFLSEIRFIQKEWKLALEAAEKGLSLDPENVECQNARAKALLKLNRREEASQTLEKALSHSPDKAETHAQRGFVLLDGGKYDEAVKAFEEALRLDPLSPKARVGLARALKARYPFYSWILKYFLWTEKLGGQTRGVLALGTYILFRALALLARENHHFIPWVLPLIGLYILGVLGTFLSDHLFNMVLCLTPAGQAVLGDEKVLKYKWYGGCVFLSLCVFAGAFSSRMYEFIFGGVMTLFLLVPLATLFQFPPGKHRNWMWIYTITTALCGAAAFTIYILSGVRTPENMSNLNFPFAMVYLCGILLASFSSKYLARKALEE